MKQIPIHTSDFAVVSRFRYCRGAENPDACFSVKFRPEVMEQQGCRPRPSFRDRHNAVQIYDRACSGLDGEQRAELVQSQPSGDMTESIDGFRVMTVGGTLWLMDELHFPMNMTFTQALRLRVYLGTLPGLGLDDPQV